MADPANRRPLASRNTRLAARTARWLADSSVTPNQISQASIVMAVVACIAFLVSANMTGTTKVLLLLAAAVFCQLRLACNLLDGMVAVEGGKASTTGAFWNEFPDRIADIFILAGLGYAADAPTLGWVAAALAVLTAYTRELGQAAGAPSDFGGPMAKPHRMAVVTIAAIVAMFETFWNGGDLVLKSALWIIVAGTIVTVFRRAGRILERLKM